MLHFAIICFIGLPRSHSNTMTHLSVLHTARYVAFPSCYLLHSLIWRLTLDYLEVLPGGLLLFLHLSDSILHNVHHQCAAQQLQGPDKFGGLMWCYAHMDGSCPIRQPIYALNREGSFQKQLLRSSTAALVC